MNLKTFLSAVFGSALAAITIKQAKKGLEPWSAMVIDMCLDQANIHKSGNLRVVYTGVSEATDRALCVLVNYNQLILHDALGIHLQRLLMGAYGSVMAIMAIESSRKSYQDSLRLGLYPVLLFFSNLIGVSVIFNGLWVPICLYYQSQNTVSSGWTVRRSRAFGILTALIVGFGLPACYITSSLVPQSSEIEQNGLAIWQFVPFLIVPLFYAFEQVFEFVGSYIDQVADEETRDRLYIAEGRDAVERTFLLLGGLNMLVYLTTFVVIGWNGVNVIDALTMLIKAPGGLPAGLTFAELGQILSTRTALLDFVFLSLGFAVWAGLSSGLREAVTVVVLSFVVGPAAAVCFYAYYREGCVQDIIRTTHIVEKKTLKTETTTTIQ